MKPTHRMLPAPPSAPEGDATFAFVGGILIVKAQSRVARYKAAGGCIASLGFESSQARLLHDGDALVYALEAR